MTYDMLIFAGWTLGSFVLGLGLGVRIAVRARTGESILPTFQDFHRHSEDQFDLDGELKKDEDRFVP